MPSATPCEPFLPSPTLPAHFFAGAAVQLVGAAAARYFWTFSEVPESSERKKTLILVAGSVVPSLILAMAGSGYAG